MSDAYQIVVGIDFGPTGDEALRMAFEIAREIPRAELHLTSVVVERSQAPSARRLAEDERMLEDTAKRLREYAEAACQADTGVRFSRSVVQHVRMGDPAEALHQVAVDVDARLIIVGTRGTRGIARLVLGSVSERLVKLARMPVLVARPRDLEGLARSPRPDAPRPGQTEADLHAPPGYEVRGTLEIGSRSSHVSGAI